MEAIEALIFHEPSPRSYRAKLVLGYRYSTLRCNTTVSIISELDIQLNIPRRCNYYIRFPVSRYVIVGWVTTLASYSLPL